MSSYGLYHPHQGLSSIGSVRDLGPGPEHDQYPIWPHSKGNFFGGFEDGLLARAEALAAVDISKSPQNMKHESLYGPQVTDMCMSQSGPSRQQMGMPPGPPGFGPSDSMLDQLSSNHGMPLPGMPDHHNMAPPSSHHNHHQMYSPMYSHQAPMNHPHAMPPHHQVHHTMHDTECDPRELEAFAERFKQRRIKLGVTQADVGSALANLKLPGVGCLSQSTICRFESLTLSHNNMIALKPILQTWLEEAEKAARDKIEAEQNGLISGADKKRKRTSIAAPEKRSLEAYFAVQPRPSGEKIAQIAEKLDLKKNVVRVWFCNQRQKQKRMKFSAVAGH
ncbi:POU domain, class 4, transcription factor 3-like isoform X2 [Mya arenaria]|uniref:POU domain, class 4, transcription factor 3-like isoform X2 n=1 Tax=Mya arenaria TaxID=6604 RepID=UPI0022E09A17|nr:POU domain, class 4, transcription factor 3-like isoform X2 [Mya arenaria]